MVISKINSYHINSGDTMELKTLFGKNVKYYRFRKCYTQEELAERMDVTPNYISRLERGMHNPPFTMIEKVAIALGIEPYELFIKRNDLQNMPDRVNLIDNRN